MEQDMQLTVLVKGCCFCDEHIIKEIASTKEIKDFFKKYIYQKG
jgi:thioredoxin-related protein